MTRSTLLSPRATARFVVTLPPEPSRIGEALRADPAAEFTALTDTNEAFQHLAARAKARLVIMIPFIDAIGASWASDLFRATSASERVLILRDVSQLAECGDAGRRLRELTTTLKDYGGRSATEETFHGKIVLADGTAAYVGSANLLRRSKAVNLECGVLVEGPAVRSVKVLVDAVLAIL